MKKAEEEIENKQQKLSEYSKHQSELLQKERNLEKQRADEMAKMVKMQKLLENEKAAVASERKKYKGKANSNTKKKKKQKKKNRSLFGFGRRTNGGGLFTINETQTQSMQSDCSSSKYSNDPEKSAGSMTDPFVTGICDDAETHVSALSDLVTPKVGAKLQKSESKRSIGTMESKASRSSRHSENSRRSKSSQLSKSSRGGHSRCDNTHGSYRSKTSNKSGRSKRSHHSHKIAESVDSRSRVDSLPRSFSRSTHSDLSDQGEMKSLLSKIDGMKLDFETNGSNISQESNRHHVTRVDRTEENEFELIYEEPNSECVLNQFSRSSLDQYIKERDKKLNEKEYNDFNMDMNENVSMKKSNDDYSVRSGFSKDTRNTFDGSRSYTTARSYTTKNTYATSMTGRTDRSNATDRTGSSRRSASTYSTYGEDFTRASYPESSRLSYQNDDNESIDSEYNHSQASESQVTNYYSVDDNMKENLQFNKMNHVANRRSQPSSALKKTAFFGLFGKKESDEKNGIKAKVKFDKNVTVGQRSGYGVKKGKVSLFGKITA